MASESFEPVVCVVDFHHARGPEVESWIGVAEGTDPAVDNDWHLLPFLALSDGAHASTEDFSYFTLVLTSTTPNRSLFGISCTRQLASEQLKNRPADVTRSTVQKAVVVITENPQTLSAVREKLSVVTRAWFSQKDFTDSEILHRFQESLVRGIENEGDQYHGLSLRELIHHFKWQTLVLFKCLLLQPKMLFYGTSCERLCLMQFSLVSLIPGLIQQNSLRDCADPKLDIYAQNLVKPTSLKTSERASLMAYMGLPLQIFGKGSLFGPYTPLQQLDMLADQDTKSYLVGSTNQLLLQQKDRYADVLINLDENTTNIFSPSLRSALALSAADRRWIDFLTQAVQDTWDDSDPSRPKDMGYTGSEEFIRLQFEEYLLAFLSSVKYRQYVEKHKDDARSSLSEVEGDPSAEFGHDFISAWTATENYVLFDRCTDSHLFDIMEPKHPCAGGMTMEDVQRRLAQQVHDMGLDERWRGSKEVIGKHLATGQQRVSGAINTLWADIEAMREAQRKRAAEQKAAMPVSVDASPRPSADSATRFSKPDIGQAQQSVQAASSRAGAYLSSWGSWAAEKRKQGWRKYDNTDNTATDAKEMKPTVAAVTEAAGDNNEKEA